MDLKNNQITVGQLLDNPSSRGVLQKRFGKVMNHPLVPAARSLSLEQLMNLAQVYIPKPVIQDALRELQKL